MTDTQLLLLTCKAYENKLKELMTPENFEIFVYAVSVEVFRVDVENLPDCDFKDFTLKHFDEITAKDFSLADFTEKTIRENFEEVDTEEELYEDWEEGEEE